MNYFELYGIAPSFNIDTAAVRKKFYELSRTHHPDYNGGGTATEQQEVLEKSAMINEAYKTLLNKDLLIKYILTSKGLLLEEEKYNLPPDFLMEVMDLNEQVMELDKTDTTAVASLMATAKNLETELYEAIEPVMEHYSESTDTEKELLQVKDYYFKKKYLDRIISGLQ
jgi:molecular chaperone HscB